MSHAGENLGGDLFATRYQDPVIEAYKKDVDRSLLRENLRLTVSQRFEHFDRFAEFAKEIHDSGVRARVQDKTAE